jgi:uncharacterized protein YodC (DUF2158 family)
MAKLVGLVSGTEHDMADIRSGDVVQLKSGGPKMTVEKVGLLTHFTDDVQRAYCRWFMTDEPKEGAFPVHMLKVADK